VQVKRTTLLNICSSACIKTAAAWLPLRACIPSLVEDWVMEMGMERDWVMEMGTERDWVMEMGTERDWDWLRWLEGQEEDQEEKKGGEGKEWEGKGEEGREKEGWEEKGVDLIQMKGSLWRSIPQDTPPLHRTQCFLSREPVKGRNVGAGEALIPLYKQSIHLCLTSQAKMHITRQWQHCYAQWSKHCPPLLRLALDMWSTCSHTHWGMLPLCCLLYSYHEPPVNSKQAGWDVGAWHRAKVVLSALT